MGLREMVRIAGRNLRSLGSDPRPLAVMIVLPFAVMALFGYTFQGGIHDVPVYVVDLDGGSANGSLAEAVVADISTRDVLSVVRVYSDGGLTGDPVEAALAAIEQGDARAVLVFDANFTADVMTAVAAARSGLPAAPVSVALYVDSSNPSIGKIVSADVQRAVQTVLAVQLHVLLPVSVSSTAVYGAGTTDYLYMVPGIMGLVAMMVGFMPAVMAFSSEMSSAGDSKTAHVRAADRVLGFALSSAALAVVQVAVVIVTMALFSVSYGDSAVIVYLVLFLLMTSAQGLGFIVATFVWKDPRAAMQSIPLVLFPSIILTGLIFPVDMVPDAVAPLSYLIPLTYATDACRDAMIRGCGVGDVWVDLLALIVFTVAALALCIIVVAKKGPSSDRVGK
jgi:ABC-2 type transport system permease protein